MKHPYRKAILSDLSAVMEIIEDGRAFLKPQGGGQWQDGYPKEENLRSDIEQGHLYAMLDEKGKVSAVAAFTYYEKDYDTLYEGKWLTDLPYIVMHRIATKSSKRGEGFGDDLFKLFEEVAKKEGYRSLRIDTHENNVIMRHLLEKNGFIFCGRAILTPNKDRMVFEKVLNS